jgi:hypothetical protein
VGFWNTPSYAYDVAVAGSYAYVADGYAGLRVIDISDPTAPLEVGSCSTPGDAHGVAVAGSYAYVADGSGGLRVIDVSDPSALAEVEYWDTPGRASRVAVAEGYVYLGDGGWGLLVFPEISHTWFEDDDAAIAYSDNGAWQQLAHPKASDGHLTYSNQTCATAEFTFEGTGLRWRVGMGPVAGKARVYLNGSPLGLVDLYRPSYSLRGLEKAGLPPSTYTLTIEVAGEKNSSSSNYFVDIDAFEVVP